MKERSVPYPIFLVLVADVAWLVAAFTIKRLATMSHVLLIVTLVLAVGTLSAVIWTVAERARRGREAHVRLLERTARDAEAAHSRDLWWQQQTFARLTAIERELDAARDRALMRSVHMDGRLDELATAQQLENSQAHMLQSLSDWAADRLADREPGQTGRPALVQVNGSRGAGHN
jgi:hypothetical protein